MISYSLDSNNILVDVGGHWDAFAMANSGTNLTRKHVLGKQLFLFVVGAEVGMIYKALFNKVRANQRPLSFTFRCDSPSHRREMVMHISPLPDLGLAVQTELLDEIQREPIPLFDPQALHTGDLIRICCICSDVRSTGNIWVPIEEESSRLQLLECTAIPGLSHGYCPRCLENQLKLLESTSEASSGH